MSNKLKFSIIAILITIIAGVGLLLVLNNPVKPANVSEPTDGELNIQLGLEKNAYSIDEEITFKSYIKNPTATGKSYTFNSTCTEGTIYINEQPTQLIQACGQAITDVDIGPYMTIEYKYPFTLVNEFSYDVSNDFIEYDGELKLPPGQHQAKLKWQGFESNELSFRIEQ